MNRSKHRKPRIRFLQGTLLSLSFAAAGVAAQTFSLGGQICTQTEETLTAEVCVDGTCYQQEVTFYDISCMPGIGSDGGFGGLGDFTGIDGVGDRGVAQDVVDEAKTDCDETTSRPVMIATGNKVQPESDFVLPTSGQPLGVIRNYNKAMSGSGVFGAKWTSNIDRTLTFVHSPGLACAGRLDTAVACSANPATLSKIVAVRGGNAGRPYELASGVWSNAEDGSSIAQAGSQWVLTNADGSVETYNAKGQPVSVQNARGVGNHYAYGGAGQLASITHTSGRSISLGWSSGRISSITAPGNKTYTYGYSGPYLASVTYPDGLGTRTYHYEDAAQPGGLTGISVNGVRYSRVSYFPDGRVKKSGLGLNGDFDSSSFTYGSGYVNVTNPLGLTTRYLTQELNGTRRVIGVERPVSAACPAGSARYTQLDVDGNVDHTLDGNGVKTDYSYDANNRLVERIAGIGPTGQTDQQQVTQYTWDPVKRDRLLVEKVFGTSATAGQAISETSYAYYPDNDARARLLQSVTVKNRSAVGVPGTTKVTTYNYTFHANKLLATMTVDGPLAGAGDAIVYSFDSAGNQVSVRNSLNHAVTYSGHNAFGQPGRVTGENGAITDFTYDARGNVLTRKEHVNGTIAATSYQYNAYGRVSQVTHPDGKVYQYQYALNGKPALISTTRPGNIPLGGDEITETRTIGYNLMGSPVHVTDQRHWVTYAPVCNPMCGPLDPDDPFGSQGQPVYNSEVTSSQFIDYDAAGFVSAMRGNNGQNLRFTYDANGNIQTQTDSLNWVTRFAYDRQGNLITSTDPIGGITRFEYDRVGRITKVIDPRGRSTTYAYDGFGQVWTQASPDTGTTTFEYNSGGLRTKMTRASGGVTNFTYDALGRPSTIVAGGQTQSVTYDNCANGKGKPCLVSDATGSVAYAYTPQGLLASQISAMPFGGGASYAYAYDTRGRLTRMTYPGGVAVNYVYAHGSLNAITANIGTATYNVATSIAHQPFGPVNGWVYGNGLTRGITYDQDGRPTSIRTNLSWNNALQNLAFQYDANSQITRITNAANTAMSNNFTYDALGRLARSERVGQPSVFSSWAYDANGNRASSAGGGVGYLLPPLDYVTDPSSNRLMAVGGGNFGYDANGNTTSSPINGGATYGYDAFNRLTQVAKGGVATSYSINALGQRVHKRVGSGAHQWFAYGPKGELASEFLGSWTHYIRMGGVPVAMVRNNQLHMIHTDQLGRPEIVTNSTKAVVWRANNSAFDRSVTLNNLGGLNLGFPGQYWDAESGLWYNLNRSYEPSTGRYVESDPIGLAGGLNTYLYAGANPISNVDPLGLCECSPLPQPDPKVTAWNLRSSTNLNTRADAARFNDSWRTYDDKRRSGIMLLLGEIPFIGSIISVADQVMIDSGQGFYAESGDRVDTGVYDIDGRMALGIEVFDSQGRQIASRTIIAERCLD